jgi:hypothetical protein
MPNVQKFVHPTWCKFNGNFKIDELNWFDWPKKSWYETSHLVNYDDVIRFEFGIIRWNFHGQEEAGWATRLVNRYPPKGNSIVIWCEKQNLRHIMTHFILVETRFFTFWNVLLDWISYISCHSCGFPICPMRVFLILLNNKFFLSPKGSILVH